MTCINVAEFVLISLLEKDHSMIETRRLKNVVIFIQTRFTYLPLGKSFGKQANIIEIQGNQEREAVRKQGAALHGA